MKPHFHTVSPVLKEALHLLMNTREFEKFILVGGTALSLHLGHRLSVDIDLFTDAPYGTVDFEAIETFLFQQYPYVEKSRVQKVSLGMPYFIGENAEQAIKLDVYYTDAFIREPVVIEGIRMAHTDDIAAMKLEVICNAGRKKDFWDLHELLQFHPLTRLIQFHQERYPYGHDEALILNKIRSCYDADDDFDPVCIKSKQWELIKLDLIEAVDQM